MAPALDASRYRTGNKRPNKRLAGFGAFGDEEGGRSSAPRNLALAAYGRTTTTTCSTATGTSGGSCGPTLRAGRRRGRILRRGGCADAIGQPDNLLDLLRQFQARRWDQRGERPAADVGDGAGGHPRILTPDGSLWHFKSRVHPLYDSLRPTLVF